MNKHIFNILRNPNKLILIHLLFGLLFVVVEEAFIPLFYVLFLSIGAWMFSGKKTSKNPLSILTLFFYLMMYESVSRLLALDPFIPWELGKYLSMLLVVLLPFRLKYNFDRGNILIGVLLLIIMLVKGVTWKGFFFNATVFYVLLFLSSPVSQIKISKERLIKMLVSLSLPLFVFVGASIDKLSNFSTKQYELSSNYILDAIPSNQIATYMGLGFFIWAIPFFVSQKDIQKSRSRYIIPLVFLFVGLLSFSRGGMITAAIGLIVMLFGQTVSGRLKQLLLGLVVILISLPLLFYLNDVTGGNLFLRYQGETRGTLVGSKEKTLDHYTTGRFTILVEDLVVFSNNVFFGVGVGESRQYRTNSKSQISHVELSRILAEHGLLGLMGIMGLILKQINRFRQSRYTLSNRFLMLAIWSVGFVTTFHGATRTIIPLIFMLVGSMVLVEEKKNNKVIST